MKVFKTLLFWFVLCTWGIVNTIIGFVMFLGMKMQGYQSYLYKGTIVTYMNPRIGAGVSFGLFIFVSQGCDGLVLHEWGTLSKLVYEVHYLCQL